MAAAKGRPLKLIRILLAGMPPLLLDIIRHVVAAEADMTVVGRLDDGDLLAATQRARADVILIGEKAKDGRESYDRLLMKQPGLKVLTIADDGKSGSLYELRPQRIPLGEISAEVLRAAIRGQEPSPSTDKA